MPTAPINHTKNDTKFQQPEITEGDIEGMTHDQIKSKKSEVENQPNTDHENPLSPRSERNLELLTDSLKAVEKTLDLLLIATVALAIAGVAVGLAVCGTGIGCAAGAPLIAASTTLMFGAGVGGATRVGVTGARLAAPVATKIIAGVGTRAATGVGTRVAAGVGTRVAAGVGTRATATAATRAATGVGTTAGTRVAGMTLGAGARRFGTTAASRVAGSAGATTAGKAAAQAAAKSPTIMGTLRAIGQGIGTAYRTVANGVRTVRGWYQAARAWPRKKWFQFGRWLGKTPLGMRWRQARIAIKRVRRWPRRYIRRQRRAAVKWVVESKLGRGVSEGLTKASNYVNNSWAGRQVSQGYNYVKDSWVGQATRWTGKTIRKGYKKAATIWAGTKGVRKLIGAALSAFGFGLEMGAMAAGAGLRAGLEGKSINAANAIKPGSRGLTNDQDRERKVFQNAEKFQEATGKNTPQREQGKARRYRIPYVQGSPQERSVRPQRSRQKSQEKDSVFGGMAR